MRKSISLILLLSIIVTSMFYGQVNASNDALNDISQSDIERLVRESLKEDEVKILEKYYEDENVVKAVQQRYYIDESGNIKLEITNINEFAKEAQLTVKNAKQYVRALNKVLEIVNDYRKEGIGKSQGEINISGYSCGQVVEVLYQFEYRTYYCDYQVEQMLDNLTICGYVFAGLSFLGPVSYYITIFSSSAGITCMALSDSIFSAFSQSGYNGVYNRVIEIPLSPNISEWKPWYM